MRVAKKLTCQPQVHLGALSTMLTLSYHAMTMELRRHRLLAAGAGEQQRGYPKG